MKTIFDHPTVPNSRLSNYKKADLLEFAITLLSERRDDLAQIERTLALARTEDSCVSKKELISLVKKLHRCGRCGK